jgi:hypothetical protein
MALPLLFEDPEEGQVEQLEDLRGVRCKCCDPHSDRIILSSCNVRYECGFDIMGKRFIVDLRRLTFLQNTNAAQIQRLSFLALPRCLPDHET